MPDDVQRAVTFYLSHQSEINRDLAPKQLANSLKACASKIAGNLAQESLLLRSLNNPWIEPQDSYWDASARLAPLFAIDWNSFGREDLFDNHGLRAALWLKEEGFAKPDSHILQIGCGIGRIERHLASLVNHVYGADISEETLRLASTWPCEVDNVTLLKMDEQQLLLPDESIDTIFSFLVFIHISSPDVWQALFTEASRVLRTDGYFLFTFDGKATSETRDFTKSPGSKCWTYNLQSRPGQFSKSKFL